MKGYCKACDRLYTLEQRATDGTPFNPANPRQAALFPEKHPKLGDDTGGEDCPGCRRAV